MSQTTQSHLGFPKDVRGMNFFSTDAALQNVLLRHDAALYRPWFQHLTDFGAWVGDENDQQAVYTDRHAPPQLEPYNKEGLLINHIVHNPAWDKAVQDVYRYGIVGLPYRSSNPAPHSLTFAMGYLLSQSDVSLHCPVTMTGAVAYVLHQFAPDDLKNTYLEKLTRMDGYNLTGGTWATEQHGGSDIGATTTTATPLATDCHQVHLNGLKWFTSNANGGLALATARPLHDAPNGTDGLGLYLVPTHLPSGQANSMRIRRLKDKLGTCGVPTGEIDLTDTWAVEVAPPPLGFKLMMEALGYSRIHNALSAVGIQKRALNEALAFASHRCAFGKTITQYPMVQAEILSIQAPWHAGLCLTFEAARAFDRAHHLPLESIDPQRTALRLYTALAKYLTAEDALWAAKRAIEVIGGNGYVYDRITPRLLRDAQVLTVWEGPANIQALEMLRLLHPKYNAFALFQQRIETLLSSVPEAHMSQLGAAHPLLQKQLQYCKEAVSYLQKVPEAAPFHARKLLDSMARTMALAVLIEQACADALSGHMQTLFMARWYAENHLTSPSKPAISAEHEWFSTHFEEMVRLTGAPE